MTARAYYNEHDPSAAAWLRVLIAEGHIATGDVDERSIVDVRHADVAGYSQAHFFAGIGGWSYALRLAGWPDNRPAWTGSCPCQPFSAAGRRLGTADERHLWPAWFELVRKCRPDVVFGEQVEAAVRLGWLDAVFADLEDEGYACGAVVLGAHSVGAPHIRQRLWFVANATGEQQPRSLQEQSRKSGFGRERVPPGGCRDVGGMADVRGSRLEGCDPRPLGDKCSSAERGGEARGLADDDAAGCSRQSGVRLQRPDVHDPDGRGPGVGGWSTVEWLPCRDGKARPIEPGIQPLAYGIPNRVGLLRGAGNAIVPQVAAEFVGAYLDARAAA